MEALKQQHWKPARIQWGTFECELRRFHVNDNIRSILLHTPNIQNCVKTLLMITSSVMWTEIEHDYVGFHTTLAGQILVSCG
jgi:hypothetical protein